MPIPELEKVRQKYPQYGDMDDITLATKLSQKYPEYFDLVEKAKTQQGGTLQPSGMIPRGNQPFSEYNLFEPEERKPRTPLSQAVETAKKGLFSGLGSFVPGGEITVKKPTLAATAAGLVTAPVPTIAGIAGEKIARSIAPEKYKEIAGLTGGLLGGFGVAGAGKGLQILKAKGTEKFIDKTLPKALGVRFSGLKHLQQVKNKLANQKEAVKFVSQNKENLGLTDEAGNELIKSPENLWDLANATQNLKRKVYTDYTQKMQEAGIKGAIINGNSMARTIRKEFGQKRYALDPHIREKALQEANLFDQIGDISPELAQQRIEDLNKVISPYIKHGVYTGRSNIAIDAFVERTLRDKLDDVITKFEGSGYQKGRNDYRNLKALEEDLFRQLTVEARKNPKGLADLTDVFTAGQIARGILTGNPTEIGVALTQGGLKGLWKRGNDRNLMIKNIFKRLENVPKTSEPTGFIPKPKTPLQLTSEAVPVARLHNINVGNVRQIAGTEMPQRLLPSPETRGILPPPKNKWYGEGFSMSRRPEDMAFMKKEIPQFKSTEEAEAFGDLNKNNPKIIKRLLDQYRDLLPQIYGLKNSKDTASLQKGYNLSVKAQLLKEALRKAGINK